MAQPLVHVLNGNYADNSLITLAATTSLLLPLPLLLVLGAGLSQFSAAVADTLAAAANIHEASRQRVSPGWGYFLVGLSAMALAWPGLVQPLK